MIRTSNVGLEKILLATSCLVNVSWGAGTEFKVTTSADYQAVQSGQNVDRKTPPQSLAWSRSDANPPGSNAESYSEATGKSEGIPLAAVSGFPGQQSKLFCSGGWR